MWCNSIFITQQLMTQTDWIAYLNLNILMRHFAHMNIYFRRQKEFYHTIIQIDWFVFLLNSVCLWMNEWMKWLKCLKCTNEWIMLGLIQPNWWLNWRLMINWKLHQIIDFVMTCLPGRSTAECWCFFYRAAIIIHDHRHQFNYRNK